MPEQFWGLQFCEFMRMCQGNERKRVEAWRHTRAILSCFSGKHPREIMPLPGDFIEEMDISERDVWDILSRTGKDKEWKVKKVYGGNSSAS